MLYDKKIPSKLLDKNQGHERKLHVTKGKIDYFVYDLNQDEYIEYDIDYKYFYNDIIRKKVFDFYFDDFKFFK